MSVIAVVARKPPTSASTSPIHVSSGTIDDEREAARHDQPSHGIESHGAQGVDFLRDLHRGELRREAGARSTGHDDRRDQRSELSKVCDDDELGDEGDGAEAPELRDAEKPDDEADQQVGGARDQEASPRRSPAGAAAASASRPSAVRRPLSAPRPRTDP